MVSSGKALFYLFFFPLSVLLAFGHICLLFVYLTVTQRASYSIHWDRCTVLNETLPVSAFMEFTRINSMAGKVDEIPLISSDKRYLRKAIETNEKSEDTLDLSYLF